MDAHIKKVYVPMTETGFYILLRSDVKKSEALSLVRKAFEFIANFKGEIPGSKRQECGNYREHDLSGAKEIASDMLNVLSEKTEADMIYEE